MDKRILFISLVGYSLMTIYYTLGFIEKYNALIGLLITISTTIIIILIIKYILENINLDDSTEESGSISEVAIIIKGKDVLIEDIEQAGNSRKKIIGKDVEGENITFRKIKQ